MRNKGAWSGETYAARSAVVAESGGRATIEGEERIKQGKGLDSLIDPKQRGVIRAANNLLIEKNGKLVLEFGVAMPVSTDVDTTGSMGDNVNIAFKVQPQVQSLLVQGKNAVLKRYHTQMATGIIQDKADAYPYLRSMFEPDNEVERQMGLLVPEGGGADSTEDYQLSLFAAGYLTDASITRYGLRGYHFMIGDEIGRNSFSEALLERVFGKNVLKLAKLDDVPTLDAAAKKVLENWHPFYLQIGANRYTSTYWGKLIGAERVIKIPQTEDLAVVQATLIGLTEGNLDLQSARDFLREAKVDKDRAKLIVEACKGIPVGLQKSFANFDKIPKAGDVFASREDIWPVGSAGAKKKSATKDEPAGAGAPPKGGKNWKL